MKAVEVSKGVTVSGPPVAGSDPVLTTAALEFVARLHRHFNPTRLGLLREREKRQQALDRGQRPDFLPETRPVRDDSWTVGPAPEDLSDRRVEITGPVDPKMMINAFNSGARVFMADFEDALSPTWANVVEGQANLIRAVERRLAFTSPDGRAYRLNPRIATLCVRPRGWHLVEKHVRIDGEPVSASLFDFGLFFFHNAKPLVQRGSGPYFYLPKMEGHREARLWNEVFDAAEGHLGLPKGRTKATCLIETILAAFEMEEILYELRTHSVGLNAGRWDYIFSLIKKFRNQSDFVLPDRAQITMTVPMMRAYTELLVQTCHRRGAHAMGGMAAFIPSRKDPNVNETALAKVREDKVREARDGFDGTWVAHPDLVPVATEAFDEALRGRPDQVNRQRDDVRVAAADLLNVRIPAAGLTEAGLRQNIDVGLQYIESWLRGTGAAAIYNLMEDTATAEISRSQVWQWIRHGPRLQGGPPVTRDLVRRLVAEEGDKIRKAWGPELSARSRLDDARRVFDRVALAPDYPEFLTLIAYDEID